MHAIAAFFAGIILLGSLSAPLSTSALTTQERTALILQLVQRVLELQQQIVALGGAPIATPPGLAALAQGNTSSAGAAASSCAIEQTLALGSRGPEVTCLQQFLISQNLLAHDSATGFFGVQTESAVRRFQAAQGLESVGHVGRLTRAAIVTAWGIHGGDTNTPPPSNPPAGGGGSNSLSGGTPTPPPAGWGGVTPPPPNNPRDTAPPTISFTAPQSGSTVSGTVAVSATASDNVGVAGVQFRLDNQNLGAEDTTAPYSISWNTASTTNGMHTLAAVARDAAGNRATSTRSVVASNAAATANTITRLWLHSEWGGQSTSTARFDPTAPETQPNRPIYSAFMRGAWTPVYSVANFPQQIRAQYIISTDSIGGTHPTYPTELRYDTLGFDADERMFLHASDPAGLSIKSGNQRVVLHWRKDQRTGVTAANSYSVYRYIEPPRVCRRLQLLRDWGHGNEDDVEELFT